MKNHFALKYLGAGDFYQTRKGLYFKGEMIAILYKLIQMRRRRWNTYLLILLKQHYLIPKPDKKCTRKKCTSISLMYIDANILRNCK